MIPTPSRRLSVRRGSVTASDPHSRQATDVQSSSRLTIVRVAPALPSPDPTAPQLASPRRISRRVPSQPATAPSSPESTRLSFAFSTFGQGCAPGGPARVPSPSSSPRIRPDRLNAGPTHLPRLSAEQLVDLARTSTSLSFSAPQFVSTSRSLPPSPCPSQPQSPTVPHRPNPAAPATFTPLPDNIYLPFIDRPAEVAALIAAPPSAKLFSLLAQTFPPTDAPTLADPATWSYAQLHVHLTLSTRQDIPDDIWALQARRAIRQHSELIWERIKGALGVPPDLDIDYDPTVPPLNLDDAPLEQVSSAMSDDSVDTDDIPDDHGRSARGHWDDWDATIESSPPSPDFALMINTNKRHRLSGWSASPTEMELAPSFQRDDDNNADHSGATSPVPLLSIEPLLFPANGTASHPPSVMPTSDVAGLDDIQERAEDEEETEVVDGQGQRPNEADEDPNFILPAQIQGLRISTEPAVAPLSRTGSVGSFQALQQPVSPLPPYANPVHAQNRKLSQSQERETPPPPPSRPHSRLSSGSYGFGAFRRTGSVGSIASLRSELSSVGGAGDLSERSGPLFPSSFAGLGSGPTLGGHPPNHKRGTLSHGSEPLSLAMGGTVSGYKRMSWRIQTPPVVGA